ncbi:glycosylated lysosomal membrane protein-like isoform X2 [Zalophus californianus]|uniref:Glycosylated lysosomal membrane protein n=1 Tax=Zalophus californianus TaxID=9704 RepID=A0A6P9EUR2_ZALCA|nr:glycosylated lysosomal membrane protein isoform X2 [Zalophus californianus]XP_035579547.1 glycosylated lysosomal membrane protein-like isoform X2 [Zalophus californianus]
MCCREGPRWGRGHCAPSPTLLLGLLMSAAPLGLLGEETRQVSLEVIPDWPGAPQNLLHIRAVGTNSTLHYVWSSMGPPAVLLVATNTPHSTLAVNWSCLLSPEPAGGLTVLPRDSVQFSSALVFTRLLEFDSTNTSEASAKPPGKPYPPYSLAEFSWNNITDSLDPATLSATFQGHPIHDPTAAFANGSLAFRLDQLVWGSLPSGFVQWRPVAFSQRQRGRDSALPCQASPVCLTLEYPLPQSPIVRAFFGSQTNFCAFNLTFGAPTGPGYWDEHYLSWSMLLGVGTPPVDSLSPLILGIMAVALGAPGLMLLAGGVVLLLGHKQCSEYQPIN